ncbi:hypothetical protein F511_45457 [Dorcoceras hygrometricum]|uniref:Uncharacterized protein n=1 Tax=Dorcoceras hygrometricum TaxID=472368 RepID=A0A2Z6ZW55_9LAMI|nr:hypothetical protein F511_45457 [Dorcoceras hygrometricum]
MVGRHTRKLLRTGRPFDARWMRHGWALFYVMLGRCARLDVRLFARLPRNVLLTAVAVRPPSGDDLRQCCDG